MEGLNIITISISFVLSFFFVGPPVLSYHYVSYHNSACSISRVSVRSATDPPRLLCAPSRLGGDHGILEIEVPDWLRPVSANIPL